MSPVIRSVLGATLLLTSASAAMAQSYGTSANDIPIVEQPAQTEASSPIVVSNNASAAAQTPKVHRGGLWCDNSDVYGGHGPKTHWGMRAFWDYQANK